MLHKLSVKQIKISQPGYRCVFLYHSIFGSNDGARIKNLNKSAGSILLFFAAALAVTSCSNPKVQSAPFEVGTEMVEITPQVGYPIYRGESTGIETPLYAKSLVFKQGEIMGALLVCDLLWIPRELSRIVRESVARQTNIA